MTNSLIAVAILVVLALAGYAGWLHYQLWKVKKQPKKSPQQVNLFEPDLASSHRIEAEKALTILAEAMLSEKMTHTEGCLRICAMASKLENSENFRREYGVLFRVAEATAHFPILDEWQALSKEQKKKLTRERIAIEQRYREAVVEAAERIRSNPC